MKAIRIEFREWSRHLLKCREKVIAAPKRWKHYASGDTAQENRVCDPNPSSLNASQTNDLAGNIWKTHGLEAGRR